MRVLLLNPCDDRSLYEEGAPIFGLLSLGTYLKEKGYEVYGIDLNYPYNNMQERYLRSPIKIVNEIRQFNPDICGITTFTYTRHNAYYWAKVIKGLNQKIKVILGGVHASAEPISILEHIPQVDFLVIGEGEITMDELCMAIKENNDLNNIKGIAFRKNGQINITPPRETIANIDLLPHIDRELFLKRETIPKIRVLEIMAGRGCPWRCKFCSSAFFWKGYRRMRSAGNIIKELEEGIRWFPNIKFIKFRDETLLANKNTAVEIMGALKKFGFPWECWSRVCDLDKDIIALMKQSGCWRVRIGIETGSKRLMKSLHKPIDLDIVPEIFHILRRYKLGYSPSFILGLPDSNLNDIYETLYLIKRIRTDPSSCTISMYTFLYPGTDYFNDFKNRNPDFCWEVIPEKYKKQPCRLDIYGNYLLPIVGPPKEMPNWKCHLLYIKATFPNHPLNSLKRLFSLGKLFFNKFACRVKNEWHRKYNKNIREKCPV